MASRSKAWTVTCGEKVVLAKSLSADLESGATLTGTPSVTIHEKTGDEAWNDVTSDFTVANKQVNAGVLTTESGETIPIGHGVVFELTASENPGEYEVRVSCAATDGTNPAATPPVALRVIGPPTP